MDRVFIGIGAASAFLSVAGGAFGAHALKARLSSDMLDVFETGARYQMYHALALILVGLLLSRGAPAGMSWLGAAGWLFTAGTILFSGSLYALAGTGNTVLGAITPLGGLTFLAGWACLLIAAVGH